MPDQTNAADWYNARYRSGQEQSFGRPPEESVQRLTKLNHEPQGRLLDVACGQGFFLKAAQDAGYQTHGIDIAHEAVAIARRVSPQSDLQVASGENLPYPDDYFDVLTCWGSLEHHPDMRRALAEFTRVTRSGGKLFLRVPNRAFWVYRAGALLGRRSGTEQQDVIEHLLTLEEWRNLFTSAGLTIHTVTADNWFLQQPFRRSDGAAGTVKLALRKLALLAPLPATYVFDFLCQVNKA